LRVNLYLIESFRNMRLNRGIHAAAQNYNKNLPISKDAYVFEKTAKETIHSTCLAVHWLDIRKSLC
jgi:hypothetical protein